MPELDFRVISATPVVGALTPILRFVLEVKTPDAVRVDTVALNAQIMLETRRRTYDAREQEALLDLFGEPARWGTTLKSMLWTHAAVNIPGFTESTTVSLDVPCTHDVSVAAGKYFHGVEHGDVPLTFQFSGTIFYVDDGALQIERIAWTKEATFKLPVDTWKQLMHEHYPEGTWICLRSDVFDRLARYKAHSARPTWEAVFDDLLAAAHEGAVR